MFASRTPRDLNRDPRPYLVHTTAGTEFRSHWTLPGDDAEFLPRPEFDHVQNNEPNPILVKFRSGNYPLGYWVYRLGKGDFPDEVEGTYLQLDHALRVLTRLTALESNE